VKSTTQVQTIRVDGQPLRVGIKRGGGTPLLIFNGIGASLELLEPFTESLTETETIVFDVPGVGGSKRRRFPYRMKSLARLAHRMLDQLGYSQVDVLGLSWGGAVAQQFARTFANRCRRLILAATTAGVTMVPGSPFVLSKMFNPRRYNDLEYLRRIAPELYGGEIRRDPRLVDRHGAHMHRPNLLGYLYQQLAFCSWSSLWWLPLIKQQTLVLAGKDDPLVPVANARILVALIPRSRLHLVEDGHLFLLNPSQLALPVIERFLAGPVTVTSTTGS
jgi:poly(3-hydroxyalkanoate) depolymerase